MNLELWMSSLARVQILVGLSAFLAGGVVAEILPSARRIDWTKAGVVGGIPTVSKVYTNLSPGVSLSTINACLASCPSNQVVYLSAGNYSFDGPIDFRRREGVVLRGAGATKTFLSFNPHNGSSNIRIGEETISRVAPPSSQVRNWTAGYSQGTTTITVDNATGIPGVGHLLVLDQLDDNVLVDSDIQEGCNYCGRENGQRTQAQYVRIAGKSGNNITIEPGLYMPNWRSSQLPQVFYWTEKDTTMCGVEDLSMTNNVSSGLFGIYITQAQNCWVKDVNIYKCPQAAVETSQCKNIELRRLGMLSAQSAGSQSYGVVWFMCSDGLLIDSISKDITASMVFAPEAEGNVVAFNFFTNNIYSPANWNIAALSSHDAHVCMNLVEGNWANTMYFDSIHGSCSHNTVFRNRLTGWQPGRDNNTVAIVFEQFCRSNNVVGNILGQPGYHNYYSVTNQATCNTSSDKTIFVLGTGNAACGSGAAPLTWDYNVPLSTLIHGNFDYVHSAQVWDPGISDHAIPTSLAAASKPAFFGSMPWPPYDPASPWANSPTNLPAGFRFVFGTDPPGTSGYRPPTPENLRVLNP